uniref:Uncharacterized protein n=1 Tax=Oryza rufipogon TaxID=4529 RepID=A0A0E0PA08_ORYRU
MRLSSAREGTESAGEGRRRCSPDPPLLSSPEAAAGSAEWERGTGEVGEFSGVGGTAAGDVRGPRGAEAVDDGGVAAERWWHRAANLGRVLSLSVASPAGSGSTLVARPRPQAPLALRHLPLLPHVFLSLFIAPLLSPHQPLSSPVPSSPFPSSSNDRTRKRVDIELSDGGISHLELLEHGSRRASAASTD